MPTASASSMTDRETCRRLAPTVRSNAISRVRWATSIEKVLRMMNAPTKTAIDAKTSRNVLMNRSPCSMSLC